MSYDSPDVEREFPGLYMDDGGSHGDGSDFSEEDHELNRLRKRELGKKKDKKDKKDKGYKMFEEEDSEEELMVPEEREVKSPVSKLKKHGKPSFRFGKKDLKFKPKEKDKDDREKKEREREKELKREEKEKKREEKKKEKMKKKMKPPEVEEPEKELPVFGVPLSLAVERSKGHDGIELPIVFRECIDYVEEHGLTCEGIYRISGVKSKVQALKDCYNRGQPGYLQEHEPNVVGSLLKTFLRELPEPVLTVELMQKFEEASTIRNPPRRADQLKRLIAELPTANSQLLSWMIVHMSHVIAKEKINRMSLQNVSIVLSPTMQISHRVLNVLFIHCKQLFGNVTIKKYVPPLRPATSKWSLEVPDDPALIQEEIKKQESLLNQLHEELNSGKITVEKEEQLWEVQRVVTQLKRKLKVVIKTLEIKEQDRLREIELKKQQEAHRIESEKKMNQEMQKLFESAKMQFMPPPTETETEQGDAETPSGAKDEHEDSDASENPKLDKEEIKDNKDGVENETRSEVNIEGSEGEEVEKPESGVDEQIEDDYLTETTSDNENEVDDENVLHLLQEHVILLLEEEELLAIRDETKKKIESESLEIERLQQDIEEIEELRSIRSRNVDSDASSSTDSSSESEEEEDDLLEILQQLMSENSRLERANASLCEKTHQESQICLEVKIQIRLLQQQQQQVDLMTNQQSVEALLSQPVGEALLASGDAGFLDRESNI